MAKYTIEVYSLLKDKNFQMFNFEYDFYTTDESIKNNFEKKFLDRYLFHEIGFETVARFKHYLREKLNRIAPYYKQLYDIEIKSKDINFLLNKDLEETFERIVEGISSDTSTTEGAETVSQGTKESYLDNGNADISLTQGNLTGVTSNDTSNNSNIKNTSTGTDNQNEKTTLISKGNIGVISSAKLVEDWRAILINIDNMILDELQELFMRIY